MRFIKIFSVSIVVLFILIGLFYFFFPDLYLKLQTSRNLSKINLKSQYIEVEKHKWAYLEGGINNKETIVFIHSYEGKKEDWIGLMSLLNQKYRVIAPDLPGFGDTAFMEDINYTAKDFSNLLNNFLNTLQVKEFHLVGTSFGGLITGYYATIFPERLNTLILIDTAGIESSHQTDFWKNFVKTGVNHLDYKSVTEFFIAMELILNKEAPVPEHMAEYYVEKKKSRLLFEKKILFDLLKDGYYALEKRLSLIKTKTLIIWGEKDRIFDVSSVSILEKNIKVNQTLILKDVGHSPFITNVEETYRAIKDFIEKK